MITSMIGNRARVRTVVSVCALGLLLSFGGARALAGEAEEARTYHEKAKAAFALSHYAQAAEFFEKAFEIKADPALLYNAAQSHRLAGNKERALTLYQNYLRVYGRDEKRAQIEQRIDELKRSIERDRREVPAQPPATWPDGSPKAGPHAAAGATKGEPPAAPAPAPVADLPKPAPAAPPAPSEPLAVAPPALAPPPPAAASSTPPAPVLVTNAAAQPEDRRSITQKPLFWVAVGGAAAVAVAVVLVLALGGSKDPTATFGQVNGN